ncbi:hypothetical protein [Streptomyces sp. NRRL S-455]|uniref:hypothetical protein n=1 Tax=Streptomyces sp. NRRL S-455 TaxID=1463908 RepID=UPI0004C23A2E|nr:hypothetical protein [Streptomyces sp. NRRL S-455]
MDGFTAFLTPTLGAGGIVLLVVLMVLRGALVPRSTVDMMREQANQQVQLWQTLAEGRQELIEIQQAQLDMLMGTAQTTERVLHAVSEAARDNRGGGRALAQAPEE